MSDHDLQAALSAYLHDEADEATIASIEHRLTDNPDERRGLIELASLVVLLSETDTSKIAMPTAPAMTTRAPRAAMIAIAAAVALIATAAAIYFQFADRPGDDGFRPATAPVATLTWTEADVIGDAPINTGESFGPQAVRTTAGQTELQFTSGASVGLRGRSELSIQTPMRATLRRGAGTFFCPTSAHGFTVGVPHGATVVDLGTRFTTAISDTGFVWVGVDEGLIEITRGEQVVRLNAGDARLVTAEGVVPIETFSIDRLIADTPASLNAYSMADAVNRGALQMVGVDSDPASGTLRLPGDDRTHATADGNVMGERGVTAAVRFRTDRVNGPAQMLLSVGNASSRDPGWSVFIERGAIRVRLLGEDHVVMLAHPITPGDWHTLVFTIDRNTGTLRAVLDGDDSADDAGWDSPEDSRSTFKTMVTAPPATPMLVGRRSAAGAPFSGAVDRLMVFDRPLDEADLLMIRHHLKPRTSAPVAAPNENALKGPETEGD